MKENPYSKLLEITKSQNRQSQSIVIGEVIASTPLTISIGELQIDKDNILISDFLLIGHERSYTTDRVIPNGSSSGNITYTDSLNVGDKLAVMTTTDKQLYIVLTRVRRL